MTSNPLILLFLPFAGLRWNRSCPAKHLRRAAHKDWARVWLWWARGTPCQGAVASACASSTLLSSHLMFFSLPLHFRNYELISELLFLPSFLCVYISRLQRYVFILGKCQIIKKTWVYKWWEIWNVGDDESVYCVLGAVLGWVTHDPCGTSFHSVSLLLVFTCLEGHHSLLPPPPVGLSQCVNPTSSARTN